MVVAFFLIEWLEALVTNLVCFIKTALVHFVNFAIAGLGLLVEALAALLPSMPSMPSMPSEVTTTLSWVNWFFPVGTVVQFFAFIVAVWLLWQGVAIGLRWAKAVRE